MCYKAGQHCADCALSALSPERGAKPVTNFVKNLSALSDWYSIYTSAIAFTVSECSPRLSQASGTPGPVFSVRPLEGSPSFGL